MRFRVRDCVVDGERFELLRGGRRVEVQPKVLSLLLHLLENRERTLTKDEILDAVWPDTVTTEGSLTRAVSFARAALGEDHQSARVIRTVRGRGYRIGVPVEVETAEPVPPPPEAGSGFLCREQELSMARDALLHAMGGRGQAMLLVGEPGIGKTRLAEEVAALARERGAAVRWGRCPEAERAPAFWPWSQIVRAEVEERGIDAMLRLAGARIGWLAELVPEIRSELPELPSPGRRDAEGDRFQLFDAVAALVRAAARERPVVLVLDDLHCADESSLQLLRFLAPELRPSPVLLLATCRDVALPPGHALEVTLAELARAQASRRTVFLGGLTERCVARFVEHVSGRPASAEQVETLRRRTDGNPLYLLELLAWRPGPEARTDESDDPDEPDDRDDPRVWERGLPDGLRQVIGRRLHALSPRCRELLEVAAVLGREFALAPLARVAGWSEAEALARLDEAERARAIDPVRERPGRFRFRHALLAETLHDGLGTAARVRLHRRAGEVLEALYTPRPLAPTRRPLGVPGEHLAELAHHFGEAAAGGDVDKAVDYALRAGRHAIAGLAFEEAARQARRALAVLESVGAADERSGPVRLVLADALARAGEVGEAENILTEVAEAAHAAGDAETLAEAAIGLSRLGVGGNVFVDDSARAAWLERALERLPPDDGALRARVLAALSSERFASGDESGWRALSSEALAMARRVGTPGALWNALRSRRLHALGPDQAEERRALIEEVGAVARETGDPEREFTASFDYRLVDAIERADPPAIARELRHCGRLAERLRQPLPTWCVLRARAARALWRGRLAEAEGLLEQARHEGRRAGERADLSYHSALLSLRRMQGRFGELEPALRADHRLARERGHKWAALVLLLAETGRPEQARAELAALGADDFAAVRRDSNYAYNLALLAEACARLEDARAADALSRRLAPFARRYLAIPAIVTAGCASRHLGLLAAVRERWTEAEAHFAVALEVEERMEARAFEAALRADWARLLEARDESGDAEAARAQRERVGALADELGLRGRFAGRD